MHRWTVQLIPPELMGAHIASAQSHTTGRYHELNFRASTAIFGHLGVEWDLTQADPRELDELSEWIALFKKHRQMLLTGTVLRADFPDETFTVGGVVSTDLSTGIYALTSLARSEVAQLGRIRLPGLEPDRRYRVTPLMLGFPPSGLVPPPWWGATDVGKDPYEQRVLHVRSRFPASGSPGVVLSGAALANAGLSAPVVDPEHTVLYLAEVIN
jgi:alpha-galactosidase